MAKDLSAEIVREDARSGVINVVELPPPNAAPPAGKAKRRLPPRAWLVLGAAVALGAGGTTWLRMAPASVATDNAYLKTDRTMVAPRVRGFVQTVLVKDNEQVRAGQPLVRLDPEEYDARLASAQSDLAAAEAAVAAARAALGRVGAEEALAASGVRESETTIEAGQAEADRAQVDARRYAALSQSGAVPRAEAERVQTQAVAAAAELARRKAAAVVSQRQVAVAAGHRAELIAGLSEALAARDRAAAALSLARQDEGHTVIRAPVEGVVGDRQVNPGDYVQPGSRLLSLTPLDRLYLVANFKETQTARMLVGQRATVRIDALPGVELKARIDSFAPGSGSDFALLPFEPGTGNFTKIVQRVPVKLVFDPGQPALARLRPGLSAKVKVTLTSSQNGLS
jgi:membrane fusion protein (multidrug efflux system)